jgi:hypothetical protein
MVKPHHFTFFYLRSGGMGPRSIAESAYSLLRRPFFCLEFEFSGPVWVPGSSCSFHEVALSQLSITVVEESSIAHTHTVPCSLIAVDYSCKPLCCDLQLQQCIVSVGDVRSQAGTVECAAGTSFCSSMVEAPPSGRGLGLGLSTITI